MKTNKNNNAITNTISKSAVMTRAWEIYHETLAAETEGIKPIFAVCLQMSWAEAHSADAPNQAARLRLEWDAMGGEAQNHWLQAMIRKVTKGEIGRSEGCSRAAHDDRCYKGKGGGYADWLETPAFGSQYQDGNLYTELVSEAWIDLGAVLDDPRRFQALTDRSIARDGKPVQMGRLVYNAACAAVRAYERDEVRTAHNVSFDAPVSDNDDKVRDLYDMLGESGRVEAKAMTTAAVRDLIRGADDKDRAVLAGLMQGDSEREIGTTLGISGPAVHKRVVKMRAVLTKTLGDLRVSGAAGKKLA